MSETDNIPNTHGASASGTGTDASNGASLPAAGVTPEAESRATKKARAKRSQIWKHFKVQEDNPNRANCKYCNTELGCNSINSGTASLNNHMKTCPKDPQKLVSKQTELNFQVSPDGNSASMVPWQYNEKEVREAFARMIVVDELPFIFAEKKVLGTSCPKLALGFGHFMSDIISLD